MYKSWLHQLPELVLHRLLEVVMVTKICFFRTVTGAIFIIKINMVCIAGNIVTDRQHSPVSTYSGRNKLVCAEQQAIDKKITLCRNIGITGKGTELPQLHGRKRIEYRWFAYNEIVKRCGCASRI
jgi:hypothetical protein